jgi:aryl-alcohol dehydrogenase-like predicted oxidoreductase
VSAARIPLRPLGTTGLIVSRMGLGLAALGRPSYINAGRDQDFGADRSIARFERRCHEMLDAAYAAGVRYVDAARSYGMAEDFLGSWLTTRGLPPGAVTVGSKWGYAYVGAWQVDAPVHEVKELSIATLQRQIGESRERLGDRLRLYQIHSATLESGVLDDNAVLDALDRLRSGGLAIGLTVSGPRQADVIRRALAVRVNGSNPFQVVQATWNILEPSAGDALADAKQIGWGVIVKEALANGRLSNRTVELDGRLKDLAHAHHVGVDAVAIAAALAQPFADVVLSGAVTTEQLASNLTAFEVQVDPTAGWPQVAEPASDYWARRSALEWT